MTDVSEQVAAAVRLWHGIEPPNDPAGRMASQLGELIAAFTRLRSQPPLEAPPADFGRTLHDLRDDPS